LEGMDIILGMDWMNRHKIILDISEWMVEINSPIVGATTLYLPFKDGVNPYSYGKSLLRWEKFQWFESLRMFYLMNCRVCHTTEMSSLSSNFSLA
jgi:hypothetical protein